MDHKQLQEIIDNRADERDPLVKMEQVSDDTFRINGQLYNLDENINDSFDFGELENRFHPSMLRFDYLVGDWGFGQLRLKGFYDDGKRVANDLKHEAINDYLVEKVNFGSDYFVLHNLDAKKKHPLPQTGSQKKKSHEFEVKKANHNVKKKNKKQNSKPAKTRRQKQKNHNHPFVIKQKDEQH